jgi:DNA ligase (NAD+)
VDASESELQAVEGIGPTIAKEIAEFFGSDRNREIIEALRDEGVDPQPTESESADGALEGLTFVFTGSIEGQTRQEVQSLIERHGGSATSSVSGNTDYLVVGENPGQNKREAADEHGVSTLDRSEFEQLLSERGVEL